MKCFPFFPPPLSFFLIWYWFKAQTGDNQKWCYSAITHLFPSFPWLWCICTACNSDFPRIHFLGASFSLRIPTPAPQVVPVCTRLMTSAPPVCIFGCKNSKVVTQNEKCFPSGYVVFSILTTTPQRRRMSVEEEEVVLEILCKNFSWVTAFCDSSWKHCFSLAPKFSYLLANLLPDLLPLLLGILVKNQQKEKGTPVMFHGTETPMQLEMGSCSPLRRTFWPQWPEFWSCVPDYFLSCCWLLRPIAMENKTFVSATGPVVVKDLITKGTYGTLAWARMEHFNCALQTLPLQRDGKWLDGAGIHFLKEMRI